jgi:tyrosyl-tRNA synthetase
MNPMIGGLIGNKMSSSEENTKIDLLDDEKTVKKKVNKGFCEEGNLENFFIQFSKLVIFPHLSDLNEEFIIDRQEKFGGKIVYKEYSELEKDFASKKLHPMDLKMGVGDYINRILTPIRKAAEQEHIKKLVKEGY